MKERIPSDSFIFLQILSGTDVQLIIQVFLQKRKCTEMQQSSSLCVLDAQPFMRGNRHFVGNIDLVRSVLNIPIQNSALPNLLHSRNHIFHNCHYFYFTFFNLGLLKRIRRSYKREVEIHQCPTQSLAPRFSYPVFIPTYSTSNCILILPLSPVSSLQPLQSGIMPQNVVCS